MGLSRLNLRQKSTVVRLLLSMMWLVGLDISQQNNLTGSSSGDSAGLYRLVHGIGPQVFFNVKVGPWFGEAQRWQKIGVSLRWALPGSGR